MIIAKNYDISERADGRVVIKNHDAPLCPSCGVLMSGYDTRLRHCIGSDGTSRWYSLRRMRCPSCEHLHLELPDFMEPKKHYGSQVIRDTLAGIEKGCPAEDSTIRRWRK